MFTLMFYLKKDLLIRKRPKNRFKNKILSQSLMTIKELRTLKESLTSNAK